MTDMLTATCYDRKPAERASAWAVDGRTLFVEQVQSERPWSLYTMQTAYCIVQCTQHKYPLEVATSSHAQAIRAYCYNVLRIPRNTVIQTDYDV